MQQDESRKLSPAVISIIVIAIIAVAGGAMYAMSANSDRTDSTSAADSSDTPSSDTSAATSDTTSNATFADGTYSATGTYSTPGGQENVRVQATLSGGKVTAVKTTGSAQGGTSAQYQSEFLDNYEGEVVGKNVNEISLSRVAGSSLTSNGFNAALEEIMSDATS